MERIGNLKKLYNQDRQLAIHLLSFFELIGNESITSEFLPLNLFLEAVAKKGADDYGMRAPKISENSKILYTFGYRYIISSNSFTTMISIITQHHGHYFILRLYSTFLP